MQTWQGIVKEEQHWQVLMVNTGFHRGQDPRSTTAWRRERDGETARKAGSSDDPGNEVRGYMVGVE